MLNISKNQMQTEPVELEDSTVGVINNTLAALFSTQAFLSLDDEEQCKLFIYAFAVRFIGLEPNDDVLTALHERLHNDLESEKEYMKHRFADGTITELYRTLFQGNSSDISNINAGKHFSKYVIYRLHILDFAIKFREAVKTNTEVMSLCKGLLSEYQAYRQARDKNETKDWFFTYLEKKADLEHKETHVDAPNSDPEANLEHKETDVDAPNSYPKAALKHKETHVNAPLSTRILNVFKSLWNMIVKLFKKAFGNKTFSSKESEAVINNNVLADQDSKKIEYLTFSSKESEAVINNNVLAEQDSKKIEYFAKWTDYTNYTNIAKGINNLNHKCKISCQEYQK
jgi:hypothetical protein